jgi:hypothetical protein
MFYFKSKYYTKVKEIQIINKTRRFKIKLIFLFLRVYMGGGTCDVMDPNLGTLYEQILTNIQ